MTSTIVIRQRDCRAASAREIVANGVEVGSRQLARSGLGQPPLERPAGVSAAGDPAGSVVYFNYPGRHDHLGEAAAEPGHAQAAVTEPVTDASRVGGQRR